MDLKQIEHQWRNSQFKKLHFDWIREDQFKDLKVRARTEYLLNEKQRLKREIRRFVDWYKKTDMPAWFMRFAKGFKDVWIVDMDRKSVFKNFGGYSIYERPRNIKRFDCGLNYYEKVKRLKSIDYELDLFKGKENKSVTDQDIEGARCIPIEKFIEVTNGWALCPAHDDKKPSLKIYEDTNTCNCFSCGFNDSVIGVVMKVYNLTFYEAVKRIIK